MDWKLTYTHNDGRIAGENLVWAHSSEDALARSNVVDGRIGEYAVKAALATRADYYDPHVTRGDREWR